MSTKSPTSPVFIKQYHSNHLIDLSNIKNFSATPPDGETVPGTIVPIQGFRMIMEGASAAAILEKIRHPDYDPEQQQYAILCITKSRVTKIGRWALNCSFLLYLISNNDNSIYQ